MRTLAALLLLLSPAGDQLELLNGTRYDGRLLKESPDTLRFEVELPGGGGKAQIDIPAKNVHTLTVGGKRRILNEKASAGKPAGSPAAAPKSAAAGGKSKGEVQSLIKQMGSTPPDWFAATPLKYPPSLDLSWTPPPQGTPWDPNKNVGQFIWSTINENEGKWKEGVRFLHHMLTVNQSKPAIVTQVMQALGAMYHNLHEDWARAAFWWQKAGNYDPVDLAHCYFKLGSKEMAVGLIGAISSDNTRHASVIRLWSEMGETARALKMAEEAGRSTPDVGYLAAGDVCPSPSRYPEALAF